MTLSSALFFFFFDKGDDQGSHSPAFCDVRAVSDGDVLSIDKPAFWSQGSWWPHDPNNQYYHFQTHGDIPEGEA